MGKPKLFFILFVAFGLIWLIVPWGPLIGLFFGLYVWLWLLAFLVVVGFTWRRACLAFFAVFPLVASSVFLPALAVAPLVLLFAFLLMWYAAAKRFGVLWGFLYVVSVHLFASVAMAVTDMLTGLAARANMVGLHPYERLDVALFLSLSAAYFAVANIVTIGLYRRFERQ
mgnify:CR=1 FL=1